MTMFVNFCTTKMLTVFSRICTNKHFQIKFRFDPTLRRILFTAFFAWTTLHPAIRIKILAQTRKKYPVIKYPDVTNNRTIASALFENSEEDKSCLRETSIDLEPFLHGTKKPLFISGQTQSSSCSFCHRPWQANRRGLKTMVQLQRTQDQMAGKRQHFGRGGGAANHGLSYWAPHSVLHWRRWVLYWNQTRVPTRIEYYGAKSFSYGKGFRSWIVVHYLKAYGYL